MSFEEMLEAVVRRVVREELSSLATPSARPELLTYPQAAELVGVGVSTIKQWVKDGALPVYGAASSRRVRPAEVVAVFKRVDSKRSSGPEAKQQAARILATLPLRRVR